MRYFVCSMYDYVLNSLYVLFSKPIVHGSILCPSALIVPNAISPECQCDQHNTKSGNWSQEMSDGGQVKGVGFVQEKECRVIVQENRRNDESKEPYHPLWIDVHGIRHHFVPAVGENVNHFQRFHSPEGDGCPNDEQSAKE